MLPTVTVKLGEGIDFAGVLKWIGFNLIPSMIYAFLILWTSLGFKRACNLTWTYPAFVLTPAFGTWTFGPVKQSNPSTSKCCTSCKSDILSVSYLHTWVNYVVSLIGHITTFLVWFYSDTYTSWIKARTSLEESLIKDVISEYGFFSNHYSLALLISWILMTTILPLSIAFVQAMDNYGKCLCICCSTKCF